MIETFALLFALSPLTPVPPLDLAQEAPVTIKTEIRYVLPATCRAHYPQDAKGKKLPVSDRYPILYRCEGGAKMLPDATYEIAPEQRKIPEKKG